MLVRFDSKAGTITTFGDVAKNLLRAMGQTGAIPGALLAQDIPHALERLRQAVAAGGEKKPARTSDDEDEPPVNLRQRALPLIELLERAAKQGADVIWEEERRAAF